MFIGTEEAASVGMEESGFVTMEGGGCVTTEEGGSVGMEGGGSVCMDEGESVRMEGGGSVSMEGGGSVSMEGGGCVGPEGGRSGSVASFDKYEKLRTRLRSDMEAAFAKRMLNKKLPRQETVKTRPERRMRSPLSNVVVTRKVVKEMCKGQQKAKKTAVSSNKIKKVLESRNSSEKCDKSNIKKRHEKNKKMTDEEDPQVQRQKSKVQKNAKKAAISSIRIKKVVETCNSRSKCKKSNMNKNDQNRKLTNQRDPKVKSSQVRRMAKKFAGQENAKEAAASIIEIRKGVNSRSSGDKSNKSKKCTKKDGKKECEKRRKAAERQRKRRALIALDPQKVEKSRKYERERNRLRKERGTLLPIAAKSPREQRRQRMLWRQSSKKFYDKKRSEAMPITPILGVHETQNASSLSNKKRVGLKKARLQRAAAARKCKHLTELLLKARKQTEKWKKRCYRRDLSSKASPSPRKIVRGVMLSGSKEIKRRLLFGEVLSRQLKQRNSYAPMRWTSRCFQNWFLVRL